MPSGYTAPIEKGIGFKDFVLNCSRAFGALVHLRDDSTAEIPDVIKPDDYYSKQVEEYSKKLDEFRKVTLAEAEQKCQAEYEKTISFYKKLDSDKLALKDKYNEMLGKVKAWNPPTSNHEGLKKFMIEQIEESINWDCSVYEPNVIKRNAEEWLAYKLEDIQKDLDRAIKSNNEEIQRAKERTEWIQALKKSL